MKVVVVVVVEEEEEDDDNGDDDDDDDDAKDDKRQIRPSPAKGTGSGRMCCEFKRTGVPKAASWIALRVCSRRKAKLTEPSQAKPSQAKLS